MNNIRPERVRLGLTQTQLGNKLNVDVSTICNWEKERGSIPSGKAVEMADLFQCSTDYLFGRTDERKATV